MQHLLSRRDFTKALGAATAAVPLLGTAAFARPLSTDEILTAFAPYYIELLGRFHESDSLLVEARLYLTGEPLPPHAYTVDIHTERQTVWPKVGPALAINVTMDVIADITGWRIRYGPKLKMGDSGNCTRACLAPGDTLHSTYTITGATIE